MSTIVLEAKTIEKLRIFSIILVKLKLSDFKYLNFKNMLMARPFKNSIDYLTNVLKTFNQICYNVFHIKVFSVLNSEIS